MHALPTVDLLPLTSSPLPLVARSYYWFMIAMQLVTLIGLAVLAGVKLLAASGLSWLAWLTVLTALFIQGSDTFLAIKDLGNLVSV